MRSPAERDRKRDNAEQLAACGGHGRHAGKRKVEREERHAERRQRHVAGADLAVHQPAAQYRAGADADRERREEQGHDAAAGAQRLLGKGRDLRQEHRADQPEPRRAEDRQLDVAALPGLAQDRRRSRRPGCG